MTRLLASLLLLAAGASAQPKRVLYFSHTAGFRHDSIANARELLRTLDPQRWQITASEDLALITASRLREFDAVFFFTSGELALSDAQKRDLLDYVRNGGGFGATHSASDTLYSWPEYGEMLGGYFDGHPWTQRVTLDVEEPDHTVMRGLPPSFSLVDEIYQHRAFDRARVRVLMTLDTRSVDLKANGVNRTDNDFALAWVRSYGRGRVFYTALGHFGSVFEDARVQRMLRQGLEWITGLSEADTAPRGTGPAPVIAAVAEAAQFNFAGAVSPGSLVTLFGTGLTSGSSVAAESDHIRLAGTSVLLNGVPLPLLYASPRQVNVRLPDTLPDAPELTVRAGIANSPALPLRVMPVTPGIFAVTFDRDTFTLWATGLGAVDENQRTRLLPRVTHNDVEVEVLYSGQAPGFPGLYQVNARRSNTGAVASRFGLEIGGVRTGILRP
ncbi:MAG: ThuA domain-containing protein [Bryobacteraceae bacterium]|nr:ThuA domain-containing protein [Bryobacteraceae bacterium]